MKRVLLLVVCLALVPAVAGATSFTLQSYNVSLHTTDPGLVLYANNLLAQPYSFDLNTVGDSTGTLPLFRVGTTESSVNLSDDTHSYPIGVQFNFSTPGAFGGVVTGESWGWTLFLIDGAVVDWDQPLMLAFGNTGLLRVSLTDRNFAVPGSATVGANFELVRENVPEPASLLLMGLGLVGGSALVRRRKR